MFATTLQLIFCGYTWTISINEGYYRCRTQYSEESCATIVSCRTGAGSYDRSTGVVSAIEQTLKLECTDFVHFNSLSIYNKFAASVSCQKN